MLACLPVLLTAALMAPADAPCLQLRRPVGSVGVATASVDLAQARRSFPGKPLDPDDARAGWYRDAEWMPLPLQTDQLPGGAAAFTTVVPPDAANRDVAIYFVGGDTPPLPAGLRVTREGERLVVTGSTYRVVHDPAKLAGLPSRIELLPSGKVFESYSLNDRVHSKDLGGYSLRFDHQPKLELLASGPLRAQIRVTARYLNEKGEAPPSAPTATYTFSYTVDSPRVDVQADYRQHGGSWDELHLFEINFPDQAFPGWVGGSPRTTGKFESNKKGFQKTWGGLVDGDSLVGLIGSGGARFYDGRGEYGTYLHGPWVEWRVDSLSVQAGLVLSGAAGSVDRLEAEARRPAAVTLGWLMPETIAAKLAEVALRPQGEPAAVTGRLRWWVALAEAPARAGRLDEAAKRADALSAELRRGKLTPAGLDTALGRAADLLITASDSLGAGWSEGRLASLYDFKRSREYLGDPQNLWSLQLRDAKKQVTTVDHSTKVVSRRLPDGVEHVYTLPDGGPTLTLTAHLTGPRVSLHLATADPGAMSLWHITFPTLRLGALGDRAEDDRLFLARGAGWEIRNPSESGVQFGGQYPDGWSTMQYLALYDPKGGLYLATEDPHASTKELFARGPEAEGRVRYGVDWPAPDMGRPHNTWSQPGNAAIEVFDGDWYDAARIYRRWASASAPWWAERAHAKSTPREIRDLSAWVCSGSTPYEPDNTVARTLEFSKYMGVPTAIHWYNWHQIPFDDDYPHYNPAKPRVPEGVAELQRGGVKVMPYINGRLWDSTLEDFATLAKPFATVDEDGKPYIEEYGSKVPLAPMCPATSFWQDKVREIVLWLQNDIGVDGVYIDQVAAASPRLCMNPAHGHPLGGGSWWTEGGYWKLLTKLRAAMKPGKFITTECNGEPYQQYFDGYLTWHWQYADQVPAFSAVYADQVILFGRAYRGGPTSDLANRMKAAQSLCFGEQIGWVDTTVIHSPSGPFVRECARTHYALRAYLAGGQMLRPPTLGGDIPELTADWQWSGDWPITLPAVQRAAWQAPDGRVAVVFANFGPQPLSVTWRVDAHQLGRGAGGSLRLNWSGKPANSAPATVADGASVPLTLPAESVVAVELAR